MTVVVPMGKTSLGWWVDSTLATMKLSDVDGAIQNTVALGSPVKVERTTLVWQPVRVGASTSGEVKGWGGECVGV